MRSCCFAMVALVACRSDEPLEQLDRPNEPIPNLAWPQPAHPLPPPPPPQPGPVDPPVEIATFLADAAHTTAPWRVTIHELADRQSGRRFLGYRDQGVRVLTQSLTDELAARLALATSYTDGDVGCVGDPVGIGVARGSLTLDFVEDCSHVYLTEQGHAGRWALFSSEMAVFIRGLRKR
ncbi:MAG: hypothetical protein IPQ07_40945 [Myxococcales bacterium]|nr:hypothetical protein [Myxococcales bacterium]